MNPQAPTHSEERKFWEEFLSCLETSKSKMSGKLWYGAIVALIFAVFVLNDDAWYAIVGSPSVRGKTVLITGASMGIGAALVREYALKGASDIVMAARSVDKMEAIRDSISAQGFSTKIHVLKADLSTREASEKCISNALELLATGNTARGLDFLVLNHITNSRFGTWLVDNKALEGGHGFVSDMFATNTFSYIYMATAAMEALQQSGGQIVVISSLAGWVGPPKTAVYAATKHALMGFFDSFRIELGMLGIKNVGVTIASLGAHDTEGAAVVQPHMNADLLKWEDPNDAARVIVRAAAAKRREVFTPFMLVWPIAALRPWAPAACDWMLSLAYK